MKKNSKKVSVPVALALGVTLAVPGMVVSNVFADPDPKATAKQEISIQSFQSEATKGLTFGDYKSNLAQQFGANNANVVVKNPYGKTIYNGQDVVLEDTDVLFATAGKYTVVFTDSTDSTNSVELVVDVKGSTDGASIKFADNDIKILPSVVNPAIGTLNLPEPTVVDKDGETIENATIEVSVKFDGQAVTVANNAFAFVKDGDVYKDGTYKITYKYKVGNSVLATKTVTVEAKSSIAYNNEEEYKLGYDFDTTKPTSAEIGKETKLPSVTGKNTVTGDKVEVYYNVTATVTVDNQTTDASSMIEFKDGNFYFTPVKDGNYTIKYQVKDVYGNIANPTSNEFEIKDVKDTTSPTSMAVLPYTVDQNGNIVGDYTVANELIVSNTIRQNIMLMPIWATDNANEYVQNNLTLYRTIKNASGTEIFNEKTALTGNFANKVLVFNSTFSQADFDALQDEDATPFEIKVNGETKALKKSEVKIVSFAGENATITKDGTYTALYVSNDKAGNGVNTKKFTIVVDNDFADTTAPTVKFAENLPTSMFLEDEITFANPTATDNKDTRLTTFLTFQVKISGAYLSVENSAEYGNLEFDNEEDNFTFTLNNAKSDINTVTNVKITASSYDDKNNLGSKEQEIKVFNTGDTAQTTIASFNINVNDDADYVQGNILNLPTVVYNDDIVDFVNVKITVENNGTFFTAYNANVERDGNDLTVSGATFTASLAGTYKITYTTVDAGNNITAKVFYYTVDEDLSNIEPNFVGLGSGINGGKAEKGEEVKLPTPSVDTKSTSLTATWQVKVIEGPANYDLVGNERFTPNAVGTYKLQYVAVVTNPSVTDPTAPGYYNKTIESEVFTIEVTDTTAPEFVDFIDIEEFFENAVTAHPSTAGDTLAVGTKLDLPMPAFDADDIDLSKSYVTFANSSTSTKIYLDKEDELEQKTFSKNDTYTITYTLFDIYGNSSSKSVKVDVGDVKAPVLTIDENLIKETYNVKDEVKIDLSKIKAVDAIDGDLIIYHETEKTYSIKEDASIKITLKNTTTGNTVTNKLTSTDSDLRFAYDITEAGEYTLTIEVGDTSSKVATNSDFSFTVSSEDGAAINVEQVLSVVLVVVAVLLLGGVVTYFVLTRKSFDKKYN